MLWLFLKGMGFGLAVAAPVGPMCVLCMRQTLGRGAPMGLAIGFGIACGDGIYALVAAFGFASLSHVLLAHMALLNLVAGLFLLWFGVRTARRPAAAAAASPTLASLPRAAFGALLLTLANPPTILTFLALFTALAPAGGLGTGAAALTAGGVFAGSTLWWGGLVAAVAGARHLLSERLRRGIDVVSGVALAAFGAILLARLW